jgi:hypothetical protein
MLLKRVGVRLFGLTNVASDRFGRGRFLFWLVAVMELQTVLCSPSIDERFFAHIALVIADGHVCASTSLVLSGEFGAGCSCQLFDNCGEAKGRIYTGLITTNLLTFRAKMFLGVLHHLSLVSTNGQAQGASVQSSAAFLAVNFEVNLF